MKKKRSKSSTAEAEASWISELYASQPASTRLAWLAEQLEQYVSQPGKTMDLLLERAVRARDLETIELLVTKGANLRGFDALGAAIEAQDLAFLERLIELGADVERGVGFGQMSPLQFAIEHDCLAAAALLLDRGANIHREFFSQTALMVAARHGNEAAVRLLLERGADPSQISEFGETAASVAASLGHDRCAALLS